MPYPRLSLSAKLSRILTATFTLAGVTLGLSANAHAQTETTIYNFGTTAPNTPNSGLVFDKSGNLYGVTPYGGSGGHGVVYKLTAVSGGWQESVIYSPFRRSAPVIARLFPFMLYFPAQQLRGSGLVVATPPPSPVLRRSPFRA